MARELLSIRRRIPLDRLDEYLAGWERLRAAATSAGGRAWLFRGAGREDHYLEFLESGDLDALLERDEIGAAREALNVVFGEGAVEVWVEAQPS